MNELEDCSCLSSIKPRLSLTIFLSAWTESAPFLHSTFIPLVCNAYGQIRERVCELFHNECWHFICSDGDLYAAAPLYSDGTLLQFRRKAGNRISVWMHDQWVSGW